MDFQKTENLQSCGLKESFSTLHATSENIVFATAESLLKNYVLNNEHTLDALKKKKLIYSFQAYFINLLKLKVHKKLKEKKKTTKQN